MAENLIRVHGQELGHALALPVRACKKAQPGLHGDPGHESPVLREGWQKVQASPGETPNRAVPLSMRLVLPGNQDLPGSGYAGSGAIRHLRGGRAAMRGNRK